MPPPKIYIGSPTWSKNISKDEIVELSGVLKELGIRSVDTAPMYPLDNPGGSEKLFGELLLGDKGFFIDSRIVYEGNGDGTLTDDAIERSVEQSLANANVKKLNILYCHGPDSKTAIVEQAAAFDKQYRKGRFNKLGVCNFTPELLEEWLQVADSNGYIKPSVFQGQYNLLCRTYEDNLFPLLRKHKITFVGFSPLAGGFLTGKLTFAKGNEDLKGTRFEVSDTNDLGLGYRRWYDKPSMHVAIRKLNELCKAHDFEMSDAACRWVLYHSALDGGPLLSREKGDAVIIGPNNLSQLGQYVEAYKRGPLPDELVNGLNGLWDGVKDDAAMIIDY